MSVEGWETQRMLAALACVSASQESMQVSMQKLTQKLDEPTSGSSCFGILSQ